MLSEKGLEFELHDVDLREPPEDLGLLNPLNEVPVLIDDDLVLSESHIIMEYLDERCPPPKLMPEDPAARARARHFLFGFERELFGGVRVLEGRSDATSSAEARETARSQIREGLTTLGAVFSRNTFVLGDELSMLDLAIAPLLWRLDHYRIDLSTRAPVLAYAERIFARSAFLSSLTRAEKEMRR